MWFEMLDRLCQIFYIERLFDLLTGKVVNFHGPMQFSDSPSHMIITLPSTDCGVHLDKDQGFYTVN